ncbi:hypothetical protein P3X46_001173 [Hevea brasiliensis]|uniref:Pentatricopeptide repeat-containing protein-mitochondrial domain-containing protein n=1 Tax=Hevea brasiliensis TaxID=3981 RepID=A0ABQ9NFL9_HEVBR|nr:pentatricopeptide repeat-containing protein At1g76280 isoform X2 [Hevea brasiliensis]KAJ9189925.1 hypothetical protein P3X46_001173 [Hevea brasiliensis]
MRRSLGRVPLWSIADLFSKSKLLKHGQINVAGELGFCRSIATSVGGAILGYGKELTTNSIQKQIVDALDLGDRGRASNLLSDLGHANKSLRAADFVDIFRYCARSPDPLFAMEIWNVMQEKQIPLNNISCLFMTQALCKGGYLKEALNLINVIGEKYGTSPSLAVYNSFLGACAKLCNIVYADQCLDLMERKTMGKNEVTYTELLKLAVCKQNLSAVHEIWKDYIKYYSPSISSLKKFIWSFTRLRDISSAYQALQHMVALALQGNTSITSTAEGRLYSSRLDIPIPSNVELGLQRFDMKEFDEQFDPVKVDPCTRSIEWSTISKIGKEVDSSGIVGLDKTKCVPAMKVLRPSFTDVIYACAQNQNYRLAEQLMIQMQNLGVQPSSHTYDGFIRAVISGRGISEGIKVLEIMQERNLKPNNSTLATLSIACCQVLELDLAENLLDQISDYQYQHPYNRFLEACDTMEQPERAIRMWAKMKQLKIQPNIWTYELLFSLFGNVNAPYEDGNMLSRADSAKRIKAIEMDMTKNGVQHSHLSMKNLLKAFGAEGMVRELIEYLHSAEYLFYRSNTYLGTPIYNTVLHSLVEANESHLAIGIFKNMKSNGFWLNAATYTIMIDCCCNIKCYKSASALLSLMLRDGFYPQAATYTALIKNLLDDGNFDEALKLLDLGSSEGIQPDVLLYNSILKKAYEKGRIDVIELVAEQMHREKIEPDPSTCHYVFSAYAERHFHNTAMEALQVLSMRMICQEDHAFDEKKAEFEDDYILSEDEEAESRILEFFRGPDENIAFALLNLRYCAILGFPISWSPNETLWARRLSTNYDTIKRITH